MIRYCVTCGSKMTKTLKPANLYDSETGKREVVMIFKCPKKRFWRFAHYDMILNTYTHLKELPGDSD